MYRRQRFGALPCDFISPNDIRLSFVHIMLAECFEEELRNAASAGAMPVFERHSDAEVEDEAKSVVA